MSKKAETAQPSPSLGRHAGWTDRAPSRAMLYPTGFKTGDFGKPIVGVASA